MKRALIVSLLATLTIQIWGVLYWAVSPLPFYFLRPLPEQGRLVEELSETIPASGVYRFPYPAGEGEGAMEEFVARHRSGPLGTLFLRREGADPLSPLTLVKGFVHNLIAVLIVAWLLLRAAPGLRTYGARAGFVTVVGILAAFWVGLSPPIWLQHPWGYALFNAAYIVTAWLVAGLVLARVVRD